ncbi:hypothetical protein O181_068447, partial [Austropuccinia psidii MF-1]|nr:hypothetical protein [Austropuccinia psidii MF-1]
FPTSSNLIHLNHLHHRRRQISASQSETDNNSLFSGQGNQDHAHHELFKVTPEPTTTHLGLSLIPAFIVIFGLFSAFVKEKLYIGEAIIAVVFGIILGPYVTGVFDPRAWSSGHHFDQITLELTRIVIALSVFAVGVELPSAYILRHWRSLAWLLGPAMLLGWLISGAFIYALVPALNFLQSLVVAAAVTPTDPILAASVVGKGKYAQKHVPAHLRHLLQAESGCNDGAAFPFLFLALFLLLRDETSLTKVIGNWFLLVILYQILLGICIGTLIGILARKTLKFCKRRSMIDKESMVAMYVALALLTTGVTTLVGSDDLLAAFACGVAFAWDDWFTESIEISNFSEILDLLINSATFIYVGATIPFSSWNNLTFTLVPWKLVILGLAILMFRRLPALWALQKFIPDLKTNREAVFCGHFGPIGVGAIFISTLATSKLPTPHIPPQSSLDILALTTQPLIYLLVLFSVLIHGLSIPFFTLGRNVHSRVHSITRTWTQASGNEPSWLSRVKRVDKTNDNLFNEPKLDQSSPISPIDNNNLVNQSNLNHQSSPISPIDNNNLVNQSSLHDQSSNQINHHHHHILQVQESQVTQQTSNNHILNQNSRPHPLTTQSQPQLNPSISNPFLKHKSTHGFYLGPFHLKPKIKRTPEQEAIHKREKLLRDDWCRSNRFDVIKKDEERVYTDGRHLIIERGDGDEVEVQPLSSSSKSKSKSLGFLPSSQIPISKSSKNLTDSHTESSKFKDFIKIILKHSKGNSCAIQELIQESSNLASSTQSGDGIIQVTSESIPVPVNNSQIQPNDQLVWLEGQNVVIENLDGENVKVKPMVKKLKSSRSAPVILIHHKSDLKSYPSLQPSRSLPNSLAHQTFKESLNHSKNLKVESAEDEWEEEKSENDSVLKKHKSRQSLRRNPSSRLNRHLRRATSNRNNLLKARINEPSSSLIGTSQVKNSSCTSAVRSSRGSSPRLLRFAETPLGPSREVSPHRKKNPKRNKGGLFTFVGPATESWRKSGLSTPISESPKRSSILGTDESDQQSRQASGSIQEASSDNKQKP